MDLAKLKDRQERQIWNAQRQQRLSLAGLSIRNANGDIDLSSLGYQITIDTLTFIKQEIVEQKFYTVAPADFVPIAVGEGAFDQNILTNLVISTSGAFEEGIINQGQANDRVAQANAAISPVTVPIKNWAKGIGYSIIEIEQALRASNWDQIAALHEARATNWQLGIQDTAFLGLKGDANVKGMLNQSDVNVNTAVITKSISSMSASEFASFVANLIKVYQANCNKTAMPNMFAIPLSDYVGLGTPVSETYPMISKLEYLKKMFAEIVPGGVSVQGLAYSEAEENASRGINKQRYTLYRKDPKSLRMDIPVDLTMTQPNTYNNFNFQDAGYGQFTGAKAYRPLEMLYFDYTP